MLTSMRRTKHLIARVTVLAGFATGLAYLLWRALFSLAGTDLWLSVPVLLVEATGLAGSSLLAWALWPHPVAQPVLVGAVDAVDVIVRVQHQPEHELRATLVALRSVALVSKVLVVDATTDNDEIAGAVARVGTARFLLLDAGDVPTPDIVTRLAPSFGDERVAVVQGLGASFAEDSIEYGPHGRHDLTFEREALNPALGSRGCAVWTGSGSLVSVDALREALVAVDATATTLEMQWALSAALLSAEWRIVAPADHAVVALRVEHDESVVYADRRARVHGARRLVGGCGQTFTRRQRLALLAWCVRPLSGLRRTAFIAVVVAALYAGSAPFGAPLTVMVAAWIPGFVATSVGLYSLSGWTLRPGDRTRWSLLTMGPACGSWRPTTVASSPRARFGAGLIVAITALCLVLVLRGISDQFTHALGRMPREALVGLTVVALWSLALALDVVRLLPRRSRRRRGARVVSLLSAVLGERSARIVDLTPQSAGLLSQTAVTVGERALLTSTITTTSGTTDLRVPCVVRSVTSGDDTWRIGVQFDCITDDALADALSEFCTVERMWVCLGVAADSSTLDVRGTNYVFEQDINVLDEPFVGSGILRFAAFFALIGAVASSVSWLVGAFAGAIAVSLLVPRRRLSRPIWQ